MKRSSTREPPEPTFFVDRDLGPRVAAALRAGGLRVEAYHEHFDLDDVPDREWLRLAGSRGWVALSHNKAIRYEPRACVPSQGVLRSFATKAESITTRSSLADQSSEEWLVRSVVPSAWNRRVMTPESLATWIKGA